MRTAPSARRQPLPGTSGRTPALQLCRPGAAAWPRKLFLWASEGNVKHPRAPPANVPPGRLRACEPCSLPGTSGRTPALQLCRPKAAAYSGLPKATLDTHGPARKRTSRPFARLRTPLGAANPPEVRTTSGRTPALQLCRPKAAAWPRKLFLWAFEGDVRHPRALPANVPAGRLRACEPRWGPFARPQTLLRCGQCRLPGVKPFPGHSCTAALPGVSKAPVACPANLPQVRTVQASNRSRDVWPVWTYFS